MSRKVLFWFGRWLLLSAMLVAPTPLWALTSGDYYLHSATSDFLNTASPTAITAKFKDSPAVNRTTFQVIGTWSATPAVGALLLSPLGDLHVWLGLKTSDDQGTSFDLRAELLKNGVVVASGQTTNIQGVTRDPGLAKEVTVTFGSSAAVQLALGDVLALRLLTKVTAQGGHSSAAGLRVYYDAVSRPARFGATVTLCSAEVCNGSDDDCDLQVDEGFTVGAPCAVGIGACGRSGTQVCAADGSGTVCNATPGTPSPEACNGVDDDCDGESDEGLGTLTCGVGACSRTVAACVNGQPGQCVPGSPVAEVCNGIDDNCDGATDDGFDIGSACAAGVGACERTGVKVCAADGSGAACNATPGAPTTEVCNGVDDDCDTQVDEELGTLSCGVGACSQIVVACVNGQPGQCTPGAPGPEVCNGMDDDCDGSSDNGFDIGSSCTAGIGACQSQGAKICSAGGTTTVCNAIPGTPQPEVCGDGIDQDCNGGDPICTVAISITAPPNLSSFNRPVIAVGGTVAAEAVEVKCNDVVVGHNAGTFGGNVPLKEGTTILTCVAEDAEGNVGSASISVSLDSMPPRVTIDSPANNALVVTSPVTVTGLINDLVMGTVNGDEAGVTCNGIQAQVANRRFLVPDLPLSAGTNVITCIGEDKVGNVDSTTISVTFNSTIPKTITVVAGNNQTAGIGTALPDLLTVELRENGTPVVGKPVVFRVLQNDGVVSANGPSGRQVSVTTDSSGHAAVQFTLGSWAGAGNNQVAATATGFLGEARFVASALPAEPHNIVVDAGTLQFGVTGQPLPKPFVVAVIDRGSNRLGGVPVTFRVVEGGGTFNGQAETVVTTDTDGRAPIVLTLGPEEGFDNNVVEATFPSNPGAAAVFMASGKAVGDPADTTISGVVLDNSNTPVEGVTLHIEGTGLSTLSDAQGQFMLQSVPVGRVLLSADGSTVPPRNGMPWPKLEYEMVTIAGHDNTVGMPIYLLPIDTPRGILVDETHGGTLTLDELPGFALTVVPGSATFPDGGKRGTVSVTLVHADKVPMVPNFGQQPRFIITIQPPGTHFNPPAAMTMPNVDGLAPGQKTEMYSFDHDLGAFVSIGPATVSEDGTVVQSDPGVGVVKGGWHCGGNPSPTGGAEPVQVSVEPEFVLVVGEKREIRATGNPAPGKSPRAFIWTPGSGITINGIPTETTNGQTMTSVAMVEGTTEGETTLRVKYTCKSGHTDEKEVTVRVLKAEIRLEYDTANNNGLVTVINRENKYSEDTALKATVVYPEGHPRAGEVVTDFDEAITFSEEAGTTYYDGSDDPGVTILPQAIDAVSGVAEIILKSLSNANNEDGPPSANIRAEANEALPDVDTNPLEVKQWIDEDPKNGIIDWLEQHVNAILEAARGSGGEIGAAALLVTGMQQREVENTAAGTICGSVRGIPPTIVTISPVCPTQANRHRTNINSELSNTVLHEARHVWQFSQRERTDLGSGVVDDDQNPGTSANDDDRDFLLEKVEFISAERITEAKSGTGDNSFDQGGMEVHWESDARTFGDAHAGCCP